MCIYADKPGGPPVQEESKPSHHERRPASILPLEYPVRSTLINDRLKREVWRRPHKYTKKDKSLNLYDRD